MTEREHTNDAKERATKAFAQHVATYQEMRGANDRNMEHLIWGRPGDSIYRIEYIRNGPWLMIVGDCYEATFQWSSPVALEWISKCSSDYVLGKLRASPKGMDWREWRLEHARHELEMLLSDFDENNDEFGDWQVCGNCYPGRTEPDPNVEPANDCAVCGGAGEYTPRLPSKQRRWWNENGRSEFLDSRESWHQFLGDDGYKFLGNDYYEYANLGDLPPWELFYYLEGLKMALAQIASESAGDANVRSHATVEA